MNDEDGPPICVFIITLSSRFIYYLDKKKNKKTTTVMWEKYGDTRMYKGPLSHFTFNKSNKLSMNVVKIVR